MRLTDWAIRILVTITFLAFFFAPSEWIFRLVLICFAVVGLSCIQRGFLGGPRLLIRALMKMTVPCGGYRV